MIHTWLAKERCDVNEQQEWRETIPELLEPLMNWNDQLVATEGASSLLLQKTVIKSHLEYWLNESSQQGNGKDITVEII